MHQDAHEFFNFLLNRIVEEIEEERKSVAVGEPSIEDREFKLGLFDYLESNKLFLTVSTSVMTTTSLGSNSNSGQLPRDATLVHKLFEGVLTSETRCLTCETVCQLSCTACHVLNPECRCSYRYHRGTNPF